MGSFQIFDRNITNLRKEVSKVSEKRVVHISLVALLDVDGRILLERREGRVWGLLGGHTKLSDEGRIEAAFREVFEE